MNSPSSVRTLVIGLFIGLLSGAQAFATDAHRIALIYAGPGACEECIPAAATVAKKIGLRVHLVQPEEIGPALFKGAALWIQPGGNAITAAQTLGANNLKFIREFVESGGGYIGFCAGGFFADRWVDDDNGVAGLDIIPVSSYDYSPTTEGQGQAMHVVWGNQVRDMYFENGPRFDEPDPAAADVRARYSDGLPAVMASRFGKGRVVVSGPHPEAPAEWFTLDGLTRDDGLETDQDIAIELMKSVLPE